MNTKENGNKMLTWQQRTREKKRLSQPMNCSSMDCLCSLVSVLAVGAQAGIQDAVPWWCLQTDQQLKCHRHAIPRKRSHACGQTLAVGELADAVDASVPRRINPMVKELTERKY